MNLLQTHPKSTFATLACLFLAGGMTAGYWLRAPEVRELTATLEAAQLSGARTESNFNVAQTELARTREQSNLLQTERNALEEQLDAAEARVADLAGCVVKDADGHMLSRAEIESIREKLDSSRAEISTLNEQLRGAAYAKNDLEIRIAQLEIDADQLNDNVESLLEDNQRLSTIVQDKTERVNELVLSEQRLSTELTDSRQTLAATLPDADRARRLSSQYVGARMEYKRITATGRKLAGSGNPVSGLLNFIGDAFVGTFEAIAGEQGVDKYFLTCEGCPPVDLGTDRDRAAEQFRSLTGREPTP